MNTKKLIYQVMKTAEFEGLNNVLTAMAEWCENFSSGETYRRRAEILRATAQEIRSNA